YWNKRGPQVLMDYNKLLTESDDKKSIKIPETIGFQSQQQQQALCIVFMDRIRIHCEDGLNYTISIPFEIENVVPLDLGLLISRKHDTSKRSRSKSVTRMSSLDSVTAATTTTTTSWDISSFFASITHPLSEPCPVKVRRLNTSSASDTSLELHRLIYASTQLSDKKRLPVIVTLNLQNQKHYIWTYERRKQKTSSALKQALAAARKAKSKEEWLALNRKRKRTFSDTKAQFHEGSVNEETLYLNDIEKEVYDTMLDPSELSLTKLWSEEKRLKRFKNKPMKYVMENISSTAFFVHNLSGHELICIFNKTTGSLQLVNLEKAAQLDGDIVEFKAVAKSVIAVNATRDSHKDLVFLDTDGKPQLFVDTRIPLIPLHIHTKQDISISELTESVHNRFNVEFSDGTIDRYQINFQPQTSLVRDCLVAIDCANTVFYTKLWYRFIKLRYLNTRSNVATRPSEWEAFVVSLLSFLPLKANRKLYYSVNNHYNNMSDKDIQLRQIRASNTAYMTHELGLGIPNHVHNYGFLLDMDYVQGIPLSWTDQVFALYNNEEIIGTVDVTSIMKNLHVVYEDYRIKNTMEMHAKRLGYLLMQLSVILRNQDWIYYYHSQGIVPEFTRNLSLVDNEMQEVLIDPPNIEVCLQQMATGLGAIPALLSFFGVDTLVPTLTHCRNTYAKTVQDLWSLYHAIYYSTGDSSLFMERLHASQVTRMHIETLTKTIAAPILEALDNLKNKPPLNWSKETYNVIGRNDIFKQLQMVVTVCDPNTEIFKLPLSETSDGPVSMDSLIKEVLELPTQKCIYESDVLNMETERLRFGFGGIIEKVRTMLDASRIPEHVAPQHLTNLRYVSTGRAIYAYATHMPDLTKTLPLEPIKMAAKLLPLRTTVNLDESLWNKEFLHWPQFHNGVAAGLRISPNNYVNDSWISFCHPGELEPQHGGMLLAMGLNGILKRLTLEYWYHIIRQSCSLVSVGFIMGIAAAYRGTEDKKVTKLLSAYIPALLERDVAPFNQSNLILASSLLGLGLLHMNSCDKKMATVMLQEIGRYVTHDLSLLEADYQTCALAAGFSLGFITLGKGKQDLKAIDPDLCKKLCALMLGKEGPEKRINLDITSPGATIALGLMYLRTEASDVARLIEIPATRPLLNYVRPDFLMLRIIARNLIMWSTIQPTHEWIHGQTPSFINAEAQAMNEIDDEREVMKQAEYNIVCGACLCMGLRFAGSKNEQAFACLLDQLDRFTRLLHSPAATFQQRITKGIVSACVDVLCTAAAMVMAGTGRLELLRRLEDLYHRVNNDTTYGNHMAISMSMGMLFIGLGGYTLTTTNEAIAGLLCAFYPFYPLSTEDNRYHSQAFRHLWVLAVDSRWLMPIDVATKKPCRVPMRLEIYEDDTIPLAQKVAHKVRLEAPTV
ncbi:Anaphase-promoting complex subunit 1, partial [Rhizopus stolonifer]